MDAIEEAKKISGSYAKVARQLGISPVFLHQIRHGDRPMPPLIAGKLAELLERNPAEAVFQALERQAEKKEDAAKWRRWSKNLNVIHAAVAVAVGLSGLWGVSTTAEASKSPAGVGLSYEHNIQCVHVLRQTVIFPPYIKAVFRLLSVRLRRLWKPSRASGFSTALVSLRSRPYGPYAARSCAYVTP